MKKIIVLTALLLGGCQLYPYHEGHEDWARIGENDCVPTQGQQQQRGC